MKTTESFEKLMAVILGLFLLSGCGGGESMDEATAAGKTVADFPTATADPFKDMDGGIRLTPDEVKGRNTWILWAGGNDALWDRLARRGYGIVDLLKTIDSRQRSTRFEDKGLFNEPGFRQAEKPDEYGLWIDQGEQLPGIDPNVYGFSSGVIGLRLFPNPDFDDAAREHWNGERYYSDPEFYNDPHLVRPYRVAMTCAICHVAPHPLYPPDDPNEPEYRNLSATIGNQYWRTLGVFGNTLPDDDLIYHILGHAQPGTVDTSIIATDNNNNPNIINAIYDVEARLSVARQNTVSGDALLLAPKTAQRRVPHVLVDGADSVGVPAALNRVFVNIGTFSEHWVECHNPLVGVRPQQPFSVAHAQENSVYWQVTERRMPNLAKYLVRASKPTMKLADAPGGERYLEKDPAVLAQGRRVFAENCLVCHSSKRPPAGIEDPVERVHEWRPGFRPDEKFLAWARAEVEKPDFLDGNFLSSDARVPITVLLTNAARALQNNATTGHVWQHFSSDDYKATPSVGTIQVHEPFKQEMVPFEMPGGGPGFYRVPTLVGIWARAPFLHNNALGDYIADPSVEGRMRGFDDAIRKMFWSDRRDDLKTIPRTTKRSYLHVDARHIPIAIEGVLGTEDVLFLRRPLLLPLVTLLLGLMLFRLAGRREKKAARITIRVVAILVLLLAGALFPLNQFAAGRMNDLKIGPFPAGTPINLLTNLDPHAPHDQVRSVMLRMLEVLERIENESLSDAEGLALLEEEVGSDLFALSKSPDWVEDRGHYFAEHLSDQDKEALIAYLKTF